MKNASSWLSWRRMILLALLFGFTLLIVTRFTSMQNLVSTLIGGKWTWIVAAVLVHLLYFFLDAVLHKYSFATVGVETRVLDLFPVLLAALFVNAVAPTGGTGGAAIFIDYTSRKGQSGARTAVGVILALIADLSTLIPFLAYGVVFLYMQNKMKFYLLIGVVIFLIFIIGLSGLLYLAHARLDLLDRLFNWLHRTVNHVAGWFHNPNFLHDEWAEQNKQGFVQGANAITTHPKEFSTTLMWGMVTHIVNLAGLYMFFLGYQQPVQPGTLISAFGLGIVFYVISFIPQGVGAVEGIMGLVFISMGIPHAKAAAIAFAFRGVNFWIPVVLGLIVLPRVTSFIQSDNQSETSTQHAQSER
ncbi:MAG: lysylphosphatidylglycerol synthase transmembrane domain-containing protein [Anaerolineales bacterium]|jgi:uncharacterized protein (TIRG00374 family)